MVGRCPDCNAPIPDADANESEGVALCRGCESLHAIDSLGEWGDLPVPVGVLKDEPPSGCWMSDDGVECRVGIRARSASFGGFMAFFAALWNAGIVFFALQAAKVLATRPSGASRTPAVVLAIFLVPFVLVGVAIGVFALIGILGNVEVTIRGRRGVVFTGLGTIGWRRRFDATRVTGVRIVTSSAESERVIHAVCIDADRTIKLASMATPARRDWFAGALKTILAPSTPQRGSPADPGAILPPEE